jgi:hypothetical protein
MIPLADWGEVVPRTDAQSAVWVILREVSPLSQRERCAPSTAGRLRSRVPDVLVADWPFVMLVAVEKLPSLPIDRSGRHRVPGLML